jgi:hypothetical protein
MIRYGKRLVLSDVDVRRWTRITGFEPTAITTMADLEDYVRDCKRYYDEPSEESAFLNWLMDVEFERYGVTPAAASPRQIPVGGNAAAWEEAERELLWNIALGGDAARRMELERLLDSRPQRPE